MALDAVTIVVVRVGEGSGPLFEVAITEVRVGKDVRSLFGHDRVGSAHSVLTPEESISLQYSSATEV